VGIFDSDGHLWEDYDGIIRHLPARYRDDFDARRLSPDLFLFPPLDHFHSMPIRMRGFADRQGGIVGVDEWVEFMEQVDIDHSVLYPTRGLGYGRIRDLRFQAMVCRAYNTWLSETYIHHPSGRFSGMAMLPMQSPDLAVKELRHAVQELGLRGAMLPSHGLPTHLGSHEYWPVYEEAEQLQCGLAFHGGSHDGYGFDDLNVFAAVHALGHPFGLLICLAGLVFNGVFDKFSGLRVAFLEGGSAWIMMALERFAESYEGFMEYEDDARELIQLPDGQEVDDYIINLLQTNRIALGCEGGEHDLEYIIKRVGCCPFMYSSDFPHEVSADSCRHEVAKLSQLQISSDDKAAILGTTGREFYRFAAA
jgi:predicted TIM-barrel fold metal-dependent hydrolase